MNIPLRIFYDGRARPGHLSFSKTRRGGCQLLSRNTYLSHAADHGINFATNPDARPATPASPTITHRAPLACNRIACINDIRQISKIGFPRSTIKKTNGRQGPMLRATYKWHRRWAADTLSLARGARRHRGKSGT
jgi:hypothetical protein